MDLQEGVAEGWAFPWDLQHSRLPGEKGPASQGEGEVRAAWARGEALDAAFRVLQASSWDPHRDQGYGGHQAGWQGS